MLFYQFLTGQKVTADHASSLLDKYFNKSSSRKEHIILLVDEVSYARHRRDISIKDCQSLMVAVRPKTVSDC